MAAVVVLGLAAPGRAQTTPSLPQPGFVERRQDAATLTTSEIEAFTGPVERHCGIFTLPASLDGPPAAARKEIAAALRCVRDAQRRGRASWAVWQLAGVDATVFDGIAATAVSEVQLVQGEGGGRVRLQPCLRPRVLKDATIACANTAGPPSASDVKSALSKFERDVNLTVGKSAVPLVAAASTRVDGAIPPSDPNYLARVIGDVQRAVHEASDPNWPACPRHFAHPLEIKDNRWFCPRDAAFIADLGGLWRVLPRKR